MLLSKSFLPELRPNRVNRPRLLERLRQAAFCQLVIISAPAGFGKTTLASEWVRSEGFPTAWISLDESDNDPVRFWTGLVAAIDQLYPGAGWKCQGLLAARQPAPHQVLLTALLNDLIEHSDNKAGSQPACLVLDDTHLVNHAVIYEGLLYFIEHLPHHLRLVLIGRSDPPLPLGRLRASCRVIEIRAADLRFSLEESEVFFSRVMGFALSHANVKRLEERTEGWIAGLQLAGLALQGYTQGQGSGDIDRFIETFSGDDRYILDYLVEEVLSRLPEEMRTFLLQTSILGRMCGPLCDAVTGLPAGESQALLERCERENLFLIPLDNRRHWYRYHHLFSDLLQNQFERLDGRNAKETMEDMHRRASRWLAGQQCFPEAIEHALQCQDFERAAEWIEAYAQNGLERGEYATLKNWLERLPQIVLYSRPELLMQYAWILRYLGEMIKYEQPLSTAEELWREQGSLIRLGEALNLRADIAAAFGDGISAAVFAQQALTLLPEDDAYHRGMSWVYIGENARLRGDMEKAQQAFSTGKTLCERSGNTPWARMAAISLAQVRQAQGELSEAARLLEEVLSQTDGLPTYEGLMARLDLSMILREWDRLDDAEGMLRSVLESVEQTGQVINFSMGYLYLAILLWEKDDIAGMQWALAKHAHLADQIGDSRVHNLGSAIHAKLTLLSGNIEAAQRWKENPQWADESVCFLNELYHLIIVRLLLRQGDEEVRQALLLIETLQGAAQLQQRMGSLVEIWLLKALALIKGNDSAEACAALEESLALAQPGGYRRLYLDEGQPLIDLLNSLIRKPSLSPELRAYATQLISLANGSPGQERTTSAEAANLVLIEPLTAREIEVLHMIQSGLSNREIADKLYLTLNTVKVHAKNIFAKLDVQSRTQAVRRAEELGLI